LRFQDRPFTDHRKRYPAGLFSTGGVLCHPVKVSRKFSVRASFHIRRRDNILPYLGRILAVNSSTKRCVAADFRLVHAQLADLLHWCPVFFLWEPVRQVWFDKLWFGRFYFKQV